MAIGLSSGGRRAAAGRTMEIVAAAPVAPEHFPAGMVASTAEAAVAMTGLTWRPRRSGMPNDAAPDGKNSTSIMRRGREPSVMVVGQDRTGRALSAAGQQARSRSHEL